MMDLPLLPEDNVSHPTPLAERVRPKSLDDFVGQDDIVGEGTLLRQTLEAGELSQSLLLWGPPGCGKTTLARLIARHVRNRFVTFSAVTSGIADVKRVIADARKLHSIERRPLLLFIDEIHRFNRAQQDAFLPHIEDGTIIFIGATTENPSFEVIAPLLSRSRVFVLNALTADHILTVLRRASGDGSNSIAADAEEGVLEFIAERAQGDARVALNAIEFAASILPSKGPRVITKQLAEDAMQRRILVTDKSGEAHYNLISALHKSVRGGDVDASLYWLARMCEAGEDPIYIARRLIRMASEDIGNADPDALVLAVSVRDAAATTGYPECKLALAQCVIYLALAPKSNAIYTAYAEAAKTALTSPPYPVPPHIRNAPTQLMKDLGFGSGYIYPPDAPDAPPQEFLPDELRGQRFFKPGDAGFEKRLRERLDAFLARRPAGTDDND